MSNYAIPAKKNLYNQSVNNFGYIKLNYFGVVGPSYLNERSSAPMCRTAMGI